VIHSAYDTSYHRNPARLLLRCLLKHVVRRDALVSLLAEQRKKIMSGGALCAKTVLHALLEAREASLEVIDAIQRWRVTLVRPEAFNVRGKNYAVAMATDMGFLATGLSALKDTFGMEFGTGNPFALPCAPSSSAVAARVSGNINAPSKGKNCGEPGKLVSTTRGPAKTGGKDAPVCASVASGSTSVVLGGVSKEDGGRGGISVAGATGDGEAGSTMGAATESVDTCAKNGGGSGSSYGRSFVDGTKTPVAAAENVSVVAGEKHNGKLQSRAESHDEEEQRQRALGNRGEEGGRDGDSAFIREVLLKLGTVDDAQRARLAKAQRFLEQEVARRVALFLVVRGIGCSWFGNIIPSATG